MCFFDSIIKNVSSASVKLLNVVIMEGRKMEAKIYVVNGRWKLNILAHSLFCEGERLLLTENQYKLMEILIINNRHSLSFSQLCDYVFEDVNDERQSIRDLLTGIKKVDEALRAFIRPDRGYGYHFEATVEKISEEQSEKDDALESIKEFAFDNKSDFLDLKIIGREEEINSIHVSLMNVKVLFIGGIDGIGKSSIVKQYAFDKGREYTNIFYLQCSKNIASLIADDLIIPNMGLSRKVMNDGTLEDDMSYTSRKLSKMKEIVSNKTLFILDDYQGELQELELLLSLNAKFIVVTHRDLQGIDNVLLVESIDNKLYLNELFFRHYLRKDIDRTDMFLQDLFSLVGGHTLSIILMAKQMMVSRMYPEELYMKIDKEGLRNALSEDVRMNSMSTSRKAFTYISELFKVSELSPDEFRILKILCVFSPAKIRSRDLIKWLCDKKAYVIIDSLQAAGWVEVDNDLDTVYVLPVVKEVVLEHEPVCITGSEVFFQEFLKEYSDFDLFALPLNVKLYYCEIVRSLLKWNFLINDDCFSFFTKAQRLLSMFYPDESISVAYKALMQLPVLPENYYKIGYLYYCIAWTKSTKLNCRIESLEDYEKSIDYIERFLGLNTENEVLINIYADFGINLCRSGNGDKAIEYISNAISMLRRKPKDKDTVMRICWYKAFLVECYLIINDNTTAKQQLLEAYNIHSQYSGKNDAYLSNLLYRDSMIAYAEEDFERAKEMAVKGFEIYSKYYPEKTVRNVRHMCYIGCIFFMSNELETAGLYFEKARIIAEDTYEDPTGIIKSIKEEYGIYE